MSATGREGGSRARGEGNPGRGPIQREGVARGRVGLGGDLKPVAAERQSRWCHWFAAECTLVAAPTGLSPLPLLLCVGSCRTWPERNDRQRRAPTYHLALPGR